VRPLVSRIPLLLPSTNSLRRPMIQLNLVIPELVIPDYIHFPPYTGELSKTEQG
jgi:hypothetical protein